MPKVFEPCPKCGRKGFYVEHGWSMNPSGTKRCRYCYYTQLPGATYVPKATLPSYADTYYDALDEALDTFQWAYQDREHNRGEIHLDRDTNKLILTIFVEDSEDESWQHGETPLLPLEGRFEVDMTKSPTEMIRAVVHAYVTHEADEQMWFNNERIFDPHKIDA
jgi:hypothetical protein